MRETKKARVAAFIEDDPTTDGYRVGARYLSDNSFGPRAEVYIADGWLHIITDEHEGAAVLHVEALPLLQEALAKLESKLPK